MTSTKTLAFVLPLVCVVSAECGRSNSEEPRRDAGKDQAAPVVDAQAGDLGPNSVQPNPDVAEAGLVPGGDAVPALPDTRLADVASDSSEMASGRDSPPDVGSDRRAEPDGATDAFPPGLIDGPRDVFSGKPDSAVDTLADVTLGADVKRDVSFAETSNRCHDLMADGPAHDLVYVAGALPTPLGGTIEDGLYYETAAQSFSSDGAAGPQDDGRRLTMLITGGILQVALMGGKTGETERETDQLILDVSDAGPAAFTLKRLCPQDTTPSLGGFHYSFVGSGPGATFTIIYPPGVGSSGRTMVLTLTQQ
jgi:hypothetical protein